MKRALLIFAFVALPFLAARGAETGSDESLYGFQRISTAHFEFTPEQWKLIKPAEPTHGFGAMMAPGGFLAQGFLRALDLDKDGNLSREEFAGGFTRWMTDWDVQHAGFLDAASLRAGITKDLNPFQPPAVGAPPVPPSPRGGGLTAASGKRNGLSGMMGIDFNYVHAALTLNGRRFGDVAVRYKGNGTYMDARSSEKKSLKVDLNEFVKGQKLGEQTKLNFHNNLADPSWMNEALAYELYRQAGVPAPRTGFARLSVTVPGVFENNYFGLYSVVENADGHWAEAAFHSKKGLILKPSTRELFIDKGNNWAAYAQAYDAQTEITGKQAQRVTDFARLITSGSDEELAAKLPEFLDIDEFSRFMAVTVWVSSTDSILMLGQNYHVYLHPKTMKFSFIPWDADRTFGNFFVPKPEELSIRQAWSPENRFLSRVMKVPAVQEADLARLAEFQKTIFQPEKLQRRLDELSTFIRPAVAEEGSEKLQRFETALSASPPAPSINEPKGAAPADPNSRPDAAPGAGQKPPDFFRMLAPKQIRLFITARHASVEEQLAGRSEGRPLSGGGMPFGGARGRGGGDQPSPGQPPGGGVGGPAGRPNFGLGNLLQPGLMKAADTNADGHIAPDEWSALGAKWFADWDADHNDILSTEELRAGLAKAFPMPRPGAPAAAGQ